MFVFSSCSLIPYLGCVLMHVPYFVCACVTVLAVCSVLHMCFEWIRSMGGYVPCVLDVVFRYIGMFFVSLACSMPS